ncbi:MULTISPECIES: type VII secretion target [Actinoalloteichus]|uniref:Uncharacterized protein n=1 Tax=Actinoalloteichus fjordicus TaxID=1612552 RepID=A0AAC9PPZ8_9PSEU|nr:MULTISPECIES: type VII secretion target [Actinoalloteichus]APU12574.1 hypothetical protein UA74_02435 [Actinoalloteichus fjordicus]APU18527.1 hypothetical protein UA75_02440 [Actinoalloteichus sp. GBA129-24]
MSDDFEVEPEELRGYTGLTDATAGHFTEIGAYAANKGADTSGFTGLFVILQPLVIAIGSLYEGCMEDASAKMRNLSAALNDTASDYELVERGEQGSMSALTDQASQITPS